MPQIVSQAPHHPSTKKNYAILPLCHAVKGFLQYIWKSLENSALYLCVLNPWHTWKFHASLTLLRLYSKIWSIRSDSESCSRRIYLFRRFDKLSRRTRICIHFNRKPHIYITFETIIYNNFVVIIFATKTWFKHVLYMKCCNLV